jgi:type IV pilus assembly protein PilV
MASSKFLIQMTSGRQRARLAAGFSLIEVLVSLVVIAASLLGVSAMVMRVQNDAYSAMLRTEATAFAMDISEKMLANKVNVIANPSNYTISSTSQPSCSSFTSTSAVSVDVRDISEFFCMIKQNLPSGTATITPDATTNPTKLNITIQWNDSRGTGGLTNTGASTQQLTTYFQLQ